MMMLSLHFTSPRGGVHIRKNSMVMHDNHSMDVPQSSHVHFCYSVRFRARNRAALSMNDLAMNPSLATLLPRSFHQRLSM